MSNPYTAPDADISAPGDNEEYQPKMFSLNGRIGRLRYMGWGFLFSIIAYIPIFLGAVVLGATMDGAEDDPETIAWLIGVPAVLLMLAVSFVVTRRRLHDLDRSSWFMLILFVPLLNIAMSLYLLLWPGTVGSNRFGLQPTKNGKSIWIVLVLALLVMIGIMAAVAIPAYQEYIEAATAAAS